MVARRILLGSRQNNVTLPPYRIGGVRRQAVVAALIPKQPQRDTNEIVISINGVVLVPKGRFGS
jgi:hypothetical protein